jgi:hypothetical protein
MAGGMKSLDCTRGVEENASSIFDEWAGWFREVDNEPLFFRVCWKGCPASDFYFLPIQDGIQILLELLLESESIQMKVGRKSREKKRRAQREIPMELVLLKKTVFVELRVVSSFFFVFL